jgi:hypothetical protein
LCALVGLLLSVTFAAAQSDAQTPSQAAALSSAVKANPTLVEEMAKELGSTPEEAAATAGVLFSVAKSFLKPEDFAEMSKAVPGMAALVAAVPQNEAGASSQPALLPTPGFGSSSSLPTTSPAMPVTMAMPNGVESAISALSKMGINPAMLAKAIPFLTGYLKKNGGDSMGALLGQVFKTGK